MMKALKWAAWYLVGWWLVTFLFVTPRGDQVLTRVFGWMFPDWLCKVPARVAVDCPICHDTYEDLPAHIRRCAQP